MMADGSFERMAEIDAMHRAEMGNHIDPPSPLELEPFRSGQRVKNMRDGSSGWIDRIDENGGIWFKADDKPAGYCTLELGASLSRTAWMADHPGLDGEGEIVKHHPKPSTPRGYIIPGVRDRADDLSFQIVNLNKINPILTSRYLVKGWLDRGAFSVVYGESNVGKTFFALDMAMHIAAGAEWHGNRLGQGGVVYVACEGGSGIRNRIAAIKANRPDLVASTDPADFLLLPTTLDLCGPSDAVALVKALETEQPSLIVIDTLAMAFGGGDENTAKDMGVFVQNCGVIRAATGAHVMVIHHSGKDSSKGARGSGSLRAAADTEIELTREGEVVIATQRKQRDMPTDKTFAYTLRGILIGHDEDGDAVTSAIVEATEAPAKRAPRLKGQALIAMQAFGDALAAHGAVKHGEDFPPNRQCVSLDHWREACDRHHLTDGASDSAKRTAFGRAWKALQEKQIIRVIDGFAWRCADE